MSVLGTKLHPPSPRRRLVQRARITDQLRAGAIEGARLVLVAAPAGFGKTTLLAQWLAAADRSQRRVAWLALDPGDADLRLFLTHLVAAIQTVEPEVGVDALSLLEGGGPTPPDAVLVSLINDLDVLAGPTVVALDDYHAIDTAAVHEAVTFLLENLPPRVTLAMSTRADPPLPLSRLRARGELVEVRAADLRFTTEEAEVFLNEVMGLHLEPALVAALEARTEGWAAGLQLAALSARTHAGAADGSGDVAGFVQAFSGSHRFVLDYLVEEVLSRQPDEVRAFLLDTSVLDELTGGLCDALTGRSDGQLMLETLERENLFLVPLDDERRWYRYHHLFADVLHARLIDERPDEVADLHLRASAWFKAHDDTAQAISHALAGGDTGRAADLMELAMPTMRRERREADLARWVRALPDVVVQSRPVLAVAFVGALAQALKFDTIPERLDYVEDLVRSPDGGWPEQPPPHVIVVDHDNYRSLPAHISMYRAAVALTQADLDGTIRHAKQSLALAPPQDPLARSAAGALAGLASWSSGDLAGAHAAYTESVAGLTSAGFLTDVLGCTVTLGDIRRTQGQLTAAIRTYQQALDLTEVSPGSAPLRGTADMHVGLAGVLLERNDIIGAVGHLDTNQQLERSTVCRRTHTAGESSWHGCVLPKATSTPHSTCLTKQKASTSVTSHPTCSRSPRCARGCRSGATS